MKKIIASICSLLCTSLHADTIPDLRAQEVLSMFESLGFARPEPLYTREQTERKMSGEVNGNLFTLTLFGPPYESTKMRVITATALNETLPESKTGEMSLSFLCLAASAPYTGSTPEAARIWLAQNINHPGERMFGQVKMQLITSARSRTLRISTEPLASQGTSTVVSAPDINLKTPYKLDNGTVVDPRVKSTKLPTVGMTYFDVEWDHGAPVIKDTETGWCTWPNFRARFESGKTVEVTAK